MLRAAGAGPRVWDVRGGAGQWAPVLAAAGFRVTGTPQQGGADAALLVGPDWVEGTEFQHRRLLRGVRSSLITGGVAVVALTLGAGLDGRARPRTCDAPGLRRLLLECGYLPVAAEEAGPYVWGAARAEPVPIPDLAGAAYAQPAAGLLDLRWSPDEADWLRPDPRQVWQEVLAGGATAVAEAARAYALEDPYGGTRAAPVLSGYFGQQVRSDDVTFGAGAASLLRDLMVLADGGPVLVGRHGFPDVPGWVRGAGSPVHVFDEDAPCGTWAAELARVHPALVVVDRPTLTGVVHPLAALDPVLAEAARLGAIVVVDEAYANYLGPVAGAARLTARHGNLVVVRSVSKGYCQGGLRAGFAISSPALSRRVREAVPALQVSELSLHVTLRILALPDPLRGLRRRLAEVKPPTVRVLAASGIAVAPGHPALPWVTLRDKDGIWQRLADHGVLVKRVPTAEPSAAGLLKIAVPLSETRARRLLDALGAGRR